MQNSLLLHANPWKAFDTMDRLLETFLPLPSPAVFTPFGAGTAFPPFNLWEDETTLFAEAELPGMSIDDLEVSVMGQMLSISGERKVDEQDDAKSLRRERMFGRFERTMQLPTEINPDAVEATLNEGVLYITMPKAESSRLRRITVQPGTTQSGLKSDSPAARLTDA